MFIDDKSARTAVYEYEPHFPQGFLGGCVTSHFCSEIIMSETLCNERHCQF